MNRSSGKTFAVKAEKPNNRFGNANHRCKTVEAPSVREGSIHHGLIPNQDIDFFITDAGIDQWFVVPIAQVF